MYIFISAIFFLVVFAGSEEEHKEPGGEESHATNLFRQHFSDSLRGGNGDSLRTVVNREIAARLDSARSTGLWGWISRKNVQKKEEHAGRSHTHVEEDLTHMIPKIMFVLLPLFALFISWFYSRKKYYYVQHAIFSIHFHSFVFLLFWVVTLVCKPITSYKLVIGVILGAYLLAFVYLVAALRGMYRQAVWMSLLKGMAIGLIYVVTIVGTVWALIMLAFLRA